MNKRREQHMDAQAILLIRMGKPRDALKVINTTMRKDRRTAMEWLIAAMAHQALGEKDQSADSLKKADQLRPDLQGSLHEVFDAHRTLIGDG